MCWSVTSRLPANCESLMTLAGGSSCARSKSRPARPERRCDRNWAASGLNLDTIPKCHSSRDVLGGIQRRRVIPRCVPVHSAIHFDVVVTGRAFPGAGRVRRAGLEKLSSQRFRRKIMVAFHDHGLVGFRQDDAIPGRACHDWTSCVGYCSQQLELMHLLPVVRRQTASVPPAGRNCGKSGARGCAALRKKRPGGRTDCK